MKIREEQIVTLSHTQLRSFEDRTFKYLRQWYPDNLRQCHDSALPQEKQCQKKLLSRRM